MAKSGTCSITELEEMIPWERQVYISILTNHVKEENKRLERSKHG